jgi:hypothetical protein
MPAATISGGKLKPLHDCYVIVPTNGGDFKITLNNLPDITDSKSASYNDETVIGRSSPLKTYSQSDNRTISMQIHMIVSSPEQVGLNLAYLRALQSAVYPRDGFNGAPFVPPPICRIKCGKLLADYGELCVILKSYSVKFPTEVSWDEGTFVPFKFDVDTNWDVVYKSSDLPGQDRIFMLGR